MSQNQRTKQARILRIFRKIHRLTGAFLFIVFFIIAITGLLLGWKKNSGGYLLAKSYEGTSTELNEWLTLDSLHRRAVIYLHDSISSSLSPELDRIDIRKDKGMVKFVFSEGYWAIQMDGVTGSVLHLERRRADFIENLHDFSYFDKILATHKGEIKLVYTTISGLALLTFTITGFWLWYGPIRMRREQKS